jgi:hypothetical protein
MMMMMIRHMKEKAVTAERGKDKKVSNEWMGYKEIG